MVTYWIDLNQTRLTQKSHDNPHEPKSKQNWRTNSNQPNIERPYNEKKNLKKKLHGLT
jgi:hypothetical protein